MSEALDKALEKIQRARAGISDEIDSITGAIARLEEENRTLPRQTASFAELKRGILELVKSAGERYAETSFRATISDFAKGAYRDMADLGRYGEPLTLGELDAAVKGELFPMANTRFLSGGASQGDDLVLYAVLAGGVQDALARVMDRITPADLGVQDDDSAMTREQMNEQIAANCAEIENLKTRKTLLEGELKKLS